MAKQPDIMFFLSDDHAAHAISAYGSAINQTPNLKLLKTAGYTTAVFGKWHLGGGPHVQERL